MGMIKFFNTSSCEVIIMEKISIYLSGSIKKGKDDKLENLFWTDEDVKYIINKISKYDVDVLNPATANISRVNPFENFGADLYLVKKSDFLFADLREKRGIGVGSEMTMAKYYQIPVISICPQETYYQRAKIEDVCGEDLYNWTHPFVMGLSDIVVENLIEAVDWVNEFLKNPVHIKNLGEVSRPSDKYQRTLYDWIKVDIKGIKGFEIIDESIRLYLRKQLNKSNDEGK